MSAQTSAKYQPSVGTVEDSLYGKPTKPKKRYAMCDSGYDPLNPPPLSLGLKLTPEGDVIEREVTASRLPLPPLPAEYLNSAYTPNPNPPAQGDDGPLDGRLGGNRRNGTATPTVRDPDLGHLLDPFEPHPSERKNALLDLEL